MQSSPELPLLHHPTDEESAFTPQSLIGAVRSEKRLPHTPVPRICVLDFDGDLTDWLAATGRSTPCRSWGCFHTRMDISEFDGVPAGVVPRTIGGPYAVLIAEQMLVSGAEVIVGLTSAGRVSDALPVPSLVVPDRAVRDEGTSFHYVPPGHEIDAPAGVVDVLADRLRSVGLPVARGAVWTTDAPYRETRTQLCKHAKAGVLAVEMQTASLFALAAARSARIGIVAHVTNAVDHEGEQFEKGGADLSFEIFRQIVEAGRRILNLNGG